MKKRTIYILSIMLIIISIANHVNAQLPAGYSPDNPIDIGSKSTAFRFSDTKNSDVNKSNSFLYSTGSAIIFYRLTITKPMDIIISHCGSEVSDTYARLIKGISYSDRIATSDRSSSQCPNKNQAYLKIERLQPGTYTIASYGSSKDYNGNITTTVETCAPIEYDLGVNNTSFYHSHNQDTRSSMNEYGYRPTKDVFYKFTITKKMKVSIGNSMASQGGSSISLTNSSKSSAYISKSFLPNNKESVEMNGLLSPGTYYVVSEGAFEDGIINTWISVRDPLEFSLGTRSSSFDYKHTQNTNEWTSGSTNGVFYYIYITKKTDLKLTNSAAFPSGSCISLLNSSKSTVIATKCFPQNNPSNESLVVKNIEPGTYYISSKGRSEEGNITTSIVGSVLAEFDLGTKNSSFDYYHIENTDKSRNEWNNRPTNDAIYKIYIPSNGTQLRVSNSMSSSAGSCISIWNSGKGSLIATKCFSKDNLSNESLDLNSLAAGEYYVLSEGHTENGIINTYINLIYNGDISRNKNYIKTRTYTGEKTDDYLDAIQFFDGLGSPIQAVQIGITPNKQDLVDYQVYDRFGRDSIAVLPTVIMKNDGAFVPLPKVVTNATATYTDSKPLFRPIYENSPLNQVLEQYNPGQDWHNNGKSVKTRYLTNGRGTAPTNNMELQSKDTLSGVYVACNQITLKPGFQFKSTAEKSLILKIDPSQCAKTKALSAGNIAPINPTLLVCTQYKVSNKQLLRKGSYADEQLYITEVKDEDGNTSYEFKDKLDRTILTRVINGTEKYDTYYVYDDFGKLCYVLPPMAVDKLTGYSDNDPIMLQYAYIYKYDYRNRCIKKRIPGADWIHYVYDKADRVIFTQDGEQRLKGEWMFTIPDVFGRTVLSGICKNNIQHIETYLKDVVIKAESPKGADKTNSYTGGYKGYNIIGITLTNWKLLSANYYDNYDFFKMADFNNSNLKYVANAVYGTRYGDEKPENHYMHKGLLTGSITTTMGVGEGSLYAAMYYDYKKQIIQSRSTNHMKGYDYAYTAYNFTGKPTKILNEQTVNSKKTTELYAYTYDHAGRLTETTHQLNGGTTTSLAKNEYDELGRLKKKTSNNNAVLATTYGYNVRSWTNKISGRFTQHIYYNEDIADTGNFYKNKKSYSGNISAVKWATYDSKERFYFYDYDNLSRLTDARYSVFNNGVSPAKNEKDAYTTAYKYDKHGNMTSLTRRGIVSHISDLGMIDNLNLEYTGNQLRKITDTGVNSINTNSEDFKDWTKNRDIEYAFNKNGAMYQDLNKGISNINYNSLNLPLQVDVKSPVAEARNEYLYSMGGVKLRTIKKWNSSFNNNPIVGSTINAAALDQIRTTDYVGNKIYENGTLVKILIDGGYYDTSKKKYYFYQKDHLGNNHMVLDQDGNIDQREYYYPFGMTVPELANDGNDPYKYNGKELDKAHGLNLYDYSARHYDAAIGRFTTVDPLAEDYYSWSPYVYCANNPIKYIDPDGRQILIPVSPFFAASNPVTTIGRVGALSTADKIIKVAPEASSNNKPINLPRIRIGRQTETEQLQKLGLDKNTESMTKVDPKTGREGTTIPDAMKDGQTVEIKNVKNQSMSKQLRLQEKISNENGKKPLLRINKDAQISKPVQNSFEISTYGSSSIAIPNDNTNVNSPHRVDSLEAQEKARKAKQDEGYRKAVETGHAI